MNDLMNRESSANLVAIEEARAIAEVQAKVVMAKKFPRDEKACIKKIKAACAADSLADEEVAFYAYSRGSTLINAPSIRLAEAIAQNWNNLHYGIEEVMRGSDYSEMRVHAWDYENNTGKEVKFRAGHYRDTKAGKKLVEDERDIFEVITAAASKRARQCILAQVPLYVLDEAVAAVRAAIKAKQSGIPMEKRVARMVKAFSKVVTTEQIERRLGKTLKEITEEDLESLYAIYASIKDGVTTVAEWFEGAGPAPTTGESPLAGELEKEKQGKGSTEPKQTEPASQNAPGTTSEKKDDHTPAPQPTASASSTHRAGEGTGKVARKPMIRQSILITKNNAGDQGNMELLFTGHKSKHNGKEIIGVPYEEKGIALYELHFLEPIQPGCVMPKVGNAVPGAPRYIIDAWEKYYTFFEGNKNYVRIGEPDPAGAGPDVSPKTPDQAPAGSSPSTDAKLQKDLPESANWDFKKQDLTSSLGYVLPYNQTRPINGNGLIGAMPVYNTADGLIHIWLYDRVAHTAKTPVLGVPGFKTMPEVIAHLESATDFWVKQRNLEL